MGMITASKFEYPDDVFVSAIREAASPTFERDLAAIWTEIYEAFLARQSEAS
jgi:hypothetical protein